MLLHGIGDGGKNSREDGEGKNIHMHRKPVG